MPLAPPPLAPPPPPPWTARASTSGSCDAAPLALGSGSVSLPVFESQAAPSSHIPETRMDPGTKGEEEEAKAEEEVAAAAAVAEEVVAVVPAAASPPPLPYPLVSHCGGWTTEVTSATSSRAQEEEEE